MAKATLYDRAKVKNAILTSIQQDLEAQPQSGVDVADFEKPVTRLIGATLGTGHFGLPDLKILRINAKTFNAPFATAQQRILAAVERVTEEANLSTLERNETPVVITWQTSRSSKPEALRRPEPETAPRPDAQEPLPDYEKILNGIVDAVCSEYSISRTELGAMQSRGKVYDISARQSRDRIFEARDVAIGLAEEIFNEKRGSVKTSLIAKVIGISENSYYAIKSRCEQTMQSPQAADSIGRIRQRLVDEGISTTEQHAADIRDARIILQAVQKYSAVSDEEMAGPDTSPRLNGARQLAVYYMRKYIPDLPDPDIDLLIGERGKSFIKVASSTIGRQLGKAMVVEVVAPLECDIVEQLKASGNTIASSADTAPPKVSATFTAGIGINGEHAQDIAAERAPSAIDRTPPDENEKSGRT